MEKICPAVVRQLSKLWSGASVKQVAELVSSSDRFQSQPGCRHGLKDARSLSGRPCCIGGCCLWETRFRLIGRTRRSRVRIEINVSSASRAG